MNSQASAGCLRAGPKDTWPVGGADGPGSRNPAGCFPPKSYGLNRMLQPSTLFLNLNQWAIDVGQKVSHEGKKKSPCLPLPCSRARKQNFLQHRSTPPPYPDISIYGQTDGVGEHTVHPGTSVLTQFPVCMWV